MKKILLTGASGFIGKNLLSKFENSSEYSFFIYTRATSDNELTRYIQEADYVIHLAGVSRPQNPEEFYEGNSNLTKKITDTLLQEDKNIPLLFTSSIHAETDSDFGKSKRMAEKCIVDYGTSSRAPVYVLRLTNTFGRWAKPNTHSVIATFCYNISHDLEIQISDPTKEVVLAYIDDVVETIMNLIEGKPDTNSKEMRPHYYEMVKTYTKTLAEIADAINAFKKGERQNSNDEFTSRLYTTYLSYAQIP